MVSVNVDCYASGELPCEMWTVEIFHSYFCLQLPSSKSKTKYFMKTWLIELILMHSYKTQKYFSWWFNNLLFLKEVKRNVTNQNLTSISSAYKNPMATKLALLMTVGHIAHEEKKCCISFKVFFLSLRDSISIMWVSRILLIFTDFSVINHNIW